MRDVVHVVLVLLALALAASVGLACSYDDPVLGGPFKCDDRHPCPNGETCMAGTCTGGDGSGSGSGSADGVQCGASSCGAGMQCCAGPVTSPTCQPAGTNCSGGGAATCDGIEDCAIGEACCGTSNPACDVDTCGARACQSSDDCQGAGGTMNCCRTLSYLPWGFCC